MSYSVFKAFRSALPLACALGSLMASPAAAKCELQKVAEFHVIVKDSRALVPVEINGRSVMMILDTGAGTSTLFADAASRLGLHIRDIAGGMRVYGVGGATRPLAAEIAALKLDPTGAASKFTMMVVGKSMSKDEQVVGLLGQDILAGWDIDVDLAHNVVRLLRPVGCRSDELVYWGAAYAQTSIQPDPSLFTHTTVEARLNGMAVDAYLDTGAPVSIVTLDAAARAGVRPSSPEVQRAGVSRGVGDYSATAWTAVFDSFSLGEETIKHAKISMSDMFVHATHEETGSRISKQEDDLPSMLLGADFFLAHHVLIFNSHHLVYFSYNGGPVFDTSRLPTQVSAAPTDPATPNTPSSKPSQTAAADGKGAERP